VTIDPLYLLLMCELLIGLIFFASLFGYLYFKSRNKIKTGQPVGSFSFEQLHRLLEKNISGLQKTLDSFTDTGDSEFETVIAKRIFEMNADFLRTFCDILEKEPSDVLDAVSKALTNGYQESASKQMQWAQKLYEEAPDNAPAATGLEIEGDSDLEVTQILEEVNTTEVFKMVKDKFVVYQEYSEDIKKKLKKLQSGKSKTEEYAELLAEQIAQSEEIIKELEKAYKDLKSRVAFLEKSHEEALVKADKFQKVVDGATKQTQRTNQKLEEKEKELEGLRKQLAGAGIIPPEDPSQEQPLQEGDTQVINHDEIEELSRDGQDEAAASDERSEGEDSTSQDEIKTAFIEDEASKSDEAVSAVSDSVENEEVESKESIAAESEESSGGIISQEDIESLLQGYEEDDANNEPREESEAGPVGNGELLSGNSADTDDGISIEEIEVLNDNTESDDTTGMDNPEEKMISREKRNDTDTQELLSQDELADLLKEVENESDSDMEDVEDVF